MGSTDHVFSGLRVRGHVRRELLLALEDILSLPTVSVTFDFRCLEGWVVEGVEWQGVRVRDILELAQPLEGARYVVYRAGDYSTALDLETSLAPTTIIAHSRRGVPMGVREGGPLRLVFPSQLCYESVKWLSEIEVTTSRPETNARQTALKRIGVKPTGAMGENVRGGGFLS